MKLLSSETWEAPKHILFNIAKPFWQTWWFISLSVISVLLLLVVLFYVQLRRIKHQEKKKSKLALEQSQLELRALKAQINPHFIFNAMTSVMVYMSKNQIDKAEVYLQRFSKLIRQVLENSDENLVSLQAEMKLMSHYVQLESEYFEGESIQFLTDYGNLQLEKVMVPPNLLQPFIENAIHHGLRTKKGEKLIEISFQSIDKMLNVCIKDNGIGRQAAKTINPYKMNQSYGMHISSRRIELHNQEHISSLTVEDLYLKDKPNGTLVCFNIPLFSE